MDYLAMLANGIREFRLSQKWTQEQLAERLDISLEQMQNIERQRRKPSVSVLYRLYLLGFSVDDALTDKAEPSQLQENLHALIDQASIEQLEDFTAILGVMQRKR